MNKFEEKIKKVSAHLKNHPSDYQSTISLFKIQSDAIAHELWLREIEERKRIQVYKREEQTNGK